MKHLGRQAAVFFAAIVASIAAFATPGDLDPTFGANGVQFLDFGGPTPVTIVASLRQSSGKIVVVGQWADTAMHQDKIAFGRLNIDGTPDASFGTGGWTMLGSTMSNLAPIAAVVLSDDSIRVVGKRGTDTFIATMNRDGKNSPENLVMFNPGFGETPHAIASAPGNGLVVAATCDEGSGPQACLVIYSSMGSLWGRVPLPPAGSARSHANAIVADGFSLYVAGTFEDASGGRDFFVTKVRANEWTIEPTFGTQRIDFGGKDEPAAIVMRNGGHVLVAGRSEVNGMGQVAMASMSAFDGSLDITDNPFGTGGKVVVPIKWQGVPADAAVSALLSSFALFPDGIFVLTTVRPNMSELHLVLARFDRSGALVSSWGSGGLNEIPPPAGGSAIDVGIGVHDLGPQFNWIISIGARNNAALVAAKHLPESGMVDSLYGDGGVLQTLAYAPAQDSLVTLLQHPNGGYAGVMSGNGGVYGLFKTTADGRLDNTFGSGGVVSLESGSYQIGVMPDGRIITAHEVHSVPGDPMSRTVVAVERWYPTGNRDIFFGGGRVLLDFGGHSTAGAIVVQPDGKILVGASVALNNPIRTRMAVARLNDDGSLDPSLMGSGIALVAPGLPGEEETRGMALLADGRIVVGGTGNGGWTVYRLLSNGGQDMSWNGGSAAVATSCAPATNSKLAIGPADTVVVAGYMQRTSDTDTCFARFLSNGSPDASLGGFGLVVYDFGPYDSANGVAVDGYGRIVASVAYRWPAILRLNPDGSLDTSFGGGGMTTVFNVPEGSANFAGLIRQPADEKLVGWGTGNMFGDSDALIARFEGGGAPPDTTPDPFVFTDVANMPLSTAAISNAVLITGIVGSAPVSITGGLYSIGCNGTFGNGPGVVANGQAICVMHTTASTPSTATNTTLTVGGVSDTFTSTTAPLVDTTITSSPPSPNGGNGNVFTFSSSDAAATLRFECALDAGAWATCTSPATVNPATGSHTFLVRAISNAGPDPTPASYTWQVDVTPPDTTITSNPPSLSTSTEATFTFTSNEAGVRFECSADNSPYTACTSPHTYTIQIQGGHLFNVRAIDAVGNVDPTPARYIWTVDSVAPDTTLTSTPPTTTTTNSATFAFTSNDANATFQCRIDGGPLASCTSPVSYTGLADGTHSFQVRATDQAGNVDPSPAQWFWTIDTVPPETNITSAPPALTTSQNATFAFGTNTAASFECALDAAAFAACTTPKTYSGLADGLHTFRVRAVDVAGNVDPTPAEHQWTVDTTAPDTTLTSTPPATTASNGATFAFTSNDASATFQCRLDAAAFAACTSPVSYAGLADGTHSFQVRATDAVGNVDASPAQWSWTVDTVPPDTSITSAPSATTSAQNATFTFAADGPASFECALDAEAFAACTTPKTYSALADGLHTFRVRAIDAAGNADPTPAQHQWTIDTAAPDTLVTSGPQPRTSLDTATFTFQSSESGSTFECSLDGAAYAACATPKSYSGLAEGTHTFRVRAIDGVGNVDASPSVFGWIVDRTAADTFIDASPAPVTNQATATFTFFANEGIVTFECRLDGAAFAACASPISYASLAEGNHTFEVRAIDGAGNVDATPASFTWKVDTTPPDTSFVLSPATSPTNSTSFTATMLVSIDPVTYECRLDGGAWFACTSPYTQSGLADGTHTFEVRAKDAAGNLDPTPASRTWTIDTVPPDTTIASGPSGTVASGSATFTHTSTESPSFFECRLDGGAWASCGPGISYSGLAEGTHTFEVRAKDSAGNTDPTPASRTWTVDTVAPDTTITSGPTGTVASTSASIAFSSEAGATFECRLDGAAFAACTSPVSLSGLAQGAHTFEVRAKDAAGNVDASPASRTWSVDTVAPDTAITSGPNGAVSSTTATFTTASNEVGSTFQCRLDAGAWVDCTASGPTYTGLAQGSHTFEVRATDAVGNVDATPASRTWIVDTVAPDTSITGGPLGNNNPDTATFTFDSTEAGSTFECKLDTGAFAACVSGVTYTGLPKGDHTFQVRAIDAAGNVDASPATRTWRSNK